VNSHLSYLAVKAHMDERIGAAAQARDAGARDQSAGLRRGTIGRVLRRRLPGRRFGVRVGPRPCVED
jgi:hypothetical protein